MSRLFIYDAITGVVKAICVLQLTVIIVPVKESTIYPIPVAKFHLVGSTLIVNTPPDSIPVLALRFNGSRASKTAFWLGAIVVSPFKIVSDTLLSA